MTAWKDTPDGAQWLRERDTLRAAVRDRRLPHGAVRLFFLFFQDAKAAGRDFSDLAHREISAAIGAKRHSILPWIKALETSGFIRSTALPGRHGTFERRRRFLFFLAGAEKGTGAGAEKGTGAGAEKGTQKSTVVQGGEGEWKTPHPQDGDGSPIKGLEFEPVKLGLFEREYSALRQAALAEIRRIKDDPRLQIKRLKPDVEELCDALAAGTAEQKARGAELRKDRSHYFVWGITAPGKAMLAAWEARLEEIKAASLGIRRAPRFTMSENTKKV